MNNPAVFLHKDQKLKAEQDTVEILQALTTGKLALVEENEVPNIQAETQKLEPEPEAKPEITQETDVIPETVKPTRRGFKK